MPERFDKDIESKPVSENNDYPVMPLRNTVFISSTSNTYIYRS